jgi:hypothetical protein
MRRIYVSCTDRVENPEDDPQDFGEAYVIDWDTRQVIDKISAYGPDPVTEGRSRGAAGIEWYQGRIWMATRSGFFYFDPDTYENVGSVRIDSGGFHQVKAHGDKIYLVCTSDDSFTAVSGTSVVEHVKLTASDFDPKILDCFLEHSKDAVPFGENKLHFNSIGWDGAGDMYHLYMAGGAVYNWTKKELVCAIRRNSHCHDLTLYHDDRARFLLTDSNRGHLYAVSITEKKKQLKWEGEMGEVLQRGGNREGFLRGTAIVPGEEWLFVGAAPGTILKLNMRSWEFHDKFQFCEDPKSAPYDILLDPRDWGEGNND